MSSATVVFSVQHCITHTEVLAPTCAGAALPSALEICDRPVSKREAVYGPQNEKKDIAFLDGKRQAIIRPSIPQPSHYFRCATRLFSQTYTIVNYKLTFGTGVSHLNFSTPCM